MKFEYSVNYQFRIILFWRNKVEQVGHRILENKFLGDFVFP